MASSYSPESSTENYFKNLSLLDRIIQHYRFKKVLPYIPAGAIVIDIGAGDGGLLKKISKDISRGVALDRYARRQVDGKIEFAPFDVDSEGIPAIHGVPLADVVIALAVIEHVRSPERLLRFAFEMLKQGGKVLITTPTPRSRWLLEFLSFKLGLISRKEIFDHRRYMWGYELYNLAKDTGFSSGQWFEFEFGMNTVFSAVK